MRDERAGEGRVGDANAGSDVRVRTLLASSTHVGGSYRLIELSLRPAYGYHEETRAAARLPRIPGGAAYPPSPTSPRGVIVIGVARNSITKR